MATNQKPESSTGPLLSTVITKGIYGVPLTTKSFIFVDIMKPCINIIGKTTESMYHIRAAMFISQLKSYSYKYRLLQGRGSSCRVLLLMIEILHGMTLYRPYTSKAHEFCSTVHIYIHRVMQGFYHQQSPAH